MNEHGTTSRYNAQKCRCVRCTAANRAYQQSRRIPTVFEPLAWTPRNGCLPAQCWCQAEVVKVPVEEIRACRTISCGKPECRPSLVST